MDDSVHTPTAPEPYRIRPKAPVFEKTQRAEGESPASTEKSAIRDESGEPNIGDATEETEEARDRQPKKGGKRAVLYGALFGGTLAILAAASMAAAGIQNENAAAEIEAVSGDRVFVEEAPNEPEQGWDEAEEKAETTNGQEGIQSSQDEGDENQPQSSQEESAQDEGDDGPAPAEHEHEWVDATKTVHHDAETKTVHHDAETKTVHHDAEYEEAVEHHTVCNVCLERIDGATREHSAATGHEGYTTGVPVKVQKIIKEAWDEEVVVKEAWDEEVVVKEAWDEEVAAGRKCESCGIVEEYSND